MLHSVCSTRGSHSGLETERPHTRIARGGTLTPSHGLPDENNPKLSIIDDPKMRRRSVEIVPSIDTHLSPRQEQIVSLIKQGKRNKEIAADLMLTEGTVKEYIYAIFQKTGVTNRTELAVRRRLG